MANDGRGPLSSAGRVKTFATPAVALLVLLVGFWPWFDVIGPPMDEGMLLVYPELVAHGQIPYRDFETFYGPANPYLLAGAFKLFGTHIFTERAVGLLYRVVVMIGIWGIARRWGTLAGVGSMVIAGALLMCTELVASAWVAGIGSVLAGLWITSGSAGRPSARYFFGGCLSGLALLFRPDIGPAILLSSLPFLWRAGWRSRIRYAAGLGLALLPLAIVTLAAGITNVWDNLFFYPVIASNPGRRLPLSSAEPFVLRLLFFHLIASLIAAVSGVLELRKDRDSVRGLLLLSMAILALALTPQAVQRLDFGHLLFAAVVSLPLLPIAVGNLVAGARFAARKQAIIVAGVVTTILLIAIMAPDVAIIVRSAYLFGLSNRQTAVFVEQNGRMFPYPTHEAARTAAGLFEKLQTVSKPGERLFVGPGDLRRTNYCDTYIYHLFPQLRPATYFLEMNPFSANRPHSRLAADVSSADWLVLDRALDRWNEPNRSAEFGDDAANQVVLSKFELIGDFGRFSLFRRKPAPE